MVIFWYFGPLQNQNESIRCFTWKSAGRGGFYIFILKEINSVLKLEYAAYSNPKYIKEISLLYLENKEEDLNKISILEEKVFIDKIEKIKLIIPTSIDSHYTYDLKKGIN